MDREESLTDPTVTSAVPNKCISNKRTINRSERTKYAIGTGLPHAGGGIKNTFHGVSYQMKLAMLYIVRGLQQNCQFQVGIEVEKAVKLDDLLFLYEDNAIGFFQAKHKLDETLSIKENQLLKEEDDFSISKYFYSYLQILNKQELQKELKGRDIAVMLNTNIHIDSSIIKYFEQIKTSDDKILALSTNMEQYRIIKESDLYEKLAKLLEEFEKPTSQVAEKLAKAVINNDNRVINVDEWFLRYREWLLQNVLEDTEEEEVDKTQHKYFVSFKDSFFSTSESSLLNFREAFLSTYADLSNELNKRSGKEEMTDVQNALSGVKFQIPERFIKIKMTSTRQNLIKEFLNLLVFAVKQPNETILGDIIETEIGNYMGCTDRESIASKFKLYIQDWSKQREGRYLTNKDIEQQFSVWGQETLSQFRIYEVKRYGCTFEESNDMIKNLLNFLSMENIPNVLCLYTRNGEELLSKIKVCQAIETFTSKNIGQNFVFCDIEDLIELENSKKCPLKAFSSQTYNIMFLSLLEGKLQNTEVLNRLLQIVIESNRNAEEQQSKKRLIMSISEKESEYINKCYFNKLDIKSISMNVFDYSFSELDEKSRRYLMEKGCIKLNENTITGLLSESELSLCIRDELLVKLISNELKIENAPVDPNDYYNEQVKQYYVNRSLVPIVVSQNVTKDTRFHFVRDDIPHTNVKSEEEVVVVSSNENLFEQFRKANGNVHWLKETNSEFIWVTSQGTLSNLRKYVAEQDVAKNENCIPVTNVSDLKNDVVLVSTGPGMGKSSWLSHVAQQMRKEDIFFSVRKTNLVNYCQELDRMNEESITLKQAIHFVFIATQIESSQTEESESSFNLLVVQEDGSVTFAPNSCFGHLDHLRAMVFCNLYNKGRIVLLLDGFDEIAPDYCKTTLTLLKTLKHSKLRKMWVTTRPYDLVETLEKHLETFVYTLQPLSENDQLTFFEKFWAHATNSLRTETRSYVKQFLKSLNTSTLAALQRSEENLKPNKRMSSFMGVPLHCYMLAKIFTNDFTKFCLQNKDRDPALTPLSFIELYSIFFDIKFDEILHRENLKNPKNWSLREEKKRAKNDLGKLALIHIFDTDLLLKLISDEDRSKLINSVSSGNEKIGIVEEIVDNKPLFVHQTFAEYFAAHYLAEILLSPVENDRRNAAESLLYDSATQNSEYYCLFYFLQLLGLGCFKLRKQKHL